MCVFCVTVLGSGDECPRPRTTWAYAISSLDTLANTPLCLSFFWAAYNTNPPELYCNCPDLVTNTRAHSWVSQ